MEDTEEERVEQVNSILEEDAKIMNYGERLARVVEVLSAKEFQELNSPPVKTSETERVTFLFPENSAVEHDNPSTILTQKPARESVGKRKDFHSLASKTSSLEEDNSSTEKKSEKPGTSSSVFDYLHGELRRGYLLENDEQRFTERREKFYIFLKIPREIEKFILYGFFQCVDAFLFLFTFLPLRSAVSVWFLVTRTLKVIVSVLFGGSCNHRILQPAEICDLLKVFILGCVSFGMTYVDTSMLYHIVKSQSVIKLYIMFNMLEVADKLFSSFGQDILDALYWTATEPRGRKREHLGLIPHLVMSLVYVFIHSIIVLIQATTLNVAINSQNKALLTIMLSNNFVELKSMVFKKFEKNNLFQMSCSDVRERFHYLILLFIVIIQTMKEYNWSYEQFMVLLPYCIGVIIAEILVDWTKHAFITRFNEITFEVYRDYTVSLSYDLASCKLKNAFADHSDLISRRMGFIPLPLGALVLRVVSGSIPIVGFWGFTLFFLVYLCLISAKIAISITLLGQACDAIEMHRNAQKEKMTKPRQCNSLPSSRHHSTEDLPNLVSQTKSMPQSQCASASSSIADITARAEILQENLEQPNPMFSNSTVSLNSLGMNENVFVNERFADQQAENVSTRWKSSATFGAVTRPGGDVEPKRRTSLQEKVEEPKS
ncbi:transmembrane anterior posterior transformation protein 1 homolog [Uloborus diversus]|uniref:transmembrane anterior posterior transformation protein 1 homolog n=1 Tax=Uloborus diversus TaxID=327109 RepID=UPI0024098C91|nr:transmembrane anterior posterior transformation protein 1 homolog [Uloborus diversus]